MSLFQAWHTGLSRLLGWFGQHPHAPERDLCLERLPFAVVCLDSDGLMTQVSRGWEALSGYRPWECLQHNHARFIHIEDQPLWLEGLQALRDGQAGWVRILRYLARGGELCWVEVRLQRQAGGFIASLADVSAQVPQRQQLLARHRSLSNLLDGLPLMVYRCRNNRHWSMEYVSVGSLALTGYPPEQLIDSQSVTFNSLIHPDDRERVWASVQAGVRERRPFAFDYRLLCADGSEKPVHERGCGIHSDAGELLGLEGVVMERPVAAPTTVLADTAQPAGAVAWRADW